MDFRSRDASRTVFAQNVFSEGNPQTQEPVQKIALKRTFKNLLNRRTRIWWNRIFLESYISRNLIPRGLRIQIFPSFPVNDAVLRTRWEAACHTCSLTFMTILVDMNSKSINDLGLEIDEIYKKLQTECTQDEFDNFKKEIDTSCDEWEKDISAKKNKKFQRDLQDRNDNKLYRWVHLNSQDKGGAASEAVSTSSAGTSVSSNNVAEQNYTRYNQRRKDDQSRRYNTRKRQNTNLDEGDDEPQRNLMKVINLSDVVLSEAQVAVLSKGLSFSPSSAPDHFSILKDLNLFARKMFFRRIYCQQPPVASSPTEAEVLQILEELAEEAASSRQYPKYLLPKSKNFPQISTVPAIDLFVQLVMKDIEAIPETIKGDNLNYDERQALRELKGLKEE
ncbi:uncharacterized protein [Ranitomeya imitator]|uniref:uncharacterized protein n=1 Tax=Ranitomeya imitator TaxID=111125 RepID=UPI0037E9C244